MMTVYFDCASETMVGGLIPGCLIKNGKSAGHWGLPGVRERAKQIGAQLDLWSQVGTGTEVEISLPASLAYPGFLIDQPHVCVVMRRIQKEER